MSPPIPSANTSTMCWAWRRRTAKSKTTEIQKKGVQYYVEKSNDLPGGWDGHEPKVSERFQKLLEKRTSRWTCSTPRSAWRRPSPCSNTT